MKTFHDDEDSRELPAPGSREIGKKFYVKQAKPGFTNRHPAASNPFNEAIETQTCVSWYWEREVTLTLGGESNNIFHFDFFLNRIQVRGARLAEPEV